MTRTQLNFYSSLKKILHLKNSEKFDYRVVIYKFLISLQFLIFLKCYFEKYEFLNSLILVIRTNYMHQVLLQKGK